MAALAKSRTHSVGRPLLLRHERGHLRVLLRVRRQLPLGLRHLCQRGPVVA